MKHALLEQPKELEVVVDPTPSMSDESETEPVVTMRPDMPLIEASSIFLMKQLKKLHKSALVAQEGSDPEGVHQLRVATRRLRAGLKVLEETGYEPNKTAYFRRGLGDLAQSVGKVRDSDVFLAHLEQYMSSLPGEKLVELEPLKKLVLQKREEGREVLLATLERKKIARLLAELKEFLRTSSEVTQPSDQTSVQPVLVRHFIGSSIWKRYEEVLAFETVQPFENKPEELHQLRVACKRLRYTLEFFEEALPAAAASLINELSQIQDQLGAIQDQQVATSWVTRLHKKQPDSPALQEYLEFRQKECEARMKDFEPHWNTLSSAQFQKKLARLITR